MREEHEQKITELMNTLLKRLEFEVNNQAPQHLPPIAAAISHLYQVKDGLLKGEELHLQNINFIRNINRQVNDFGDEGGQHGSNKPA